VTNTRHGHPSRNRIILVALVIVLTVALAVVSLREKKLKIAIHQGVESVALKEIVAKFANDRNFSVEVIELPYDQLYEAELDDVTGKKDHGFDVIMLDDPWMPAMLGIEKAGDDPRLLQLNVPDESIHDFVESTLSVARDPTVPASSGNAFYALPFVGNSQLFMHRRGENRSYADWNEVIEGGYIMRVGAGNQIVTDFVPMVWSRPGEGFQDGSIRFPDGALGAFELLSILGGRSQTNLSIISQDDFDLAVQLQKGKASSGIIWSAWAMAMARMPEPRRSEFFGNLEFSPMPKGKTLLGVWLLAIPANSKHADQARDFIAFATAKEQIIEAARAGNPPPLTSVLTFDIGVTDTDPVRMQKQTLAIAAFKQQFEIPFDAQLKSLKMARPRPRTRHWKSIEAAVGDCLSRLYESAISPEAAMNGANAAIDAISNEMEPASPACKSSPIKPK
jgi:multiple sugar transport system substrate-binding protein